MDTINKACGTAVNIVIAMVVVGFANKMGVFDPIKNYWKKLQKEAEE